jgi:hypothetical protein
VEHRIHRLQSAGEISRVRHIPVNEFCFQGNPPGLAVRVNALLEVVEDPNAIATLEQQVNSVGANETGPSRNENQTAA